MTDFQMRTPMLDLQVDGAPLAERCAHTCTALRIHHHLSMPSACELTFTGGQDLDALRVFRAGTRLRVAVRGSDSVLFQGCVSAVEMVYGSDRIGRVAVRAYDALMSLRNRQTSRAFVGLNAAEVAGELVADLGLDVRCEEPGPAWPRVLQTGTDFEVLADIAERSGLYFSLQDELLWLHTLQGNGAAVTLTLNENLYAASFEANANGANGRVGIKGWNPWRGSEHAAEAGSARSGRSATLQTHVGEIGGTEPRWLPAHCVQDDEQAHSLAQAELDSRSARAVVFSGTVAGDPRLRPGVHVRVAGVAASLAGEHVLCSVRHTLDPEQGFMSEVSSALPQPRPRKLGSLLAPGQVIRIDDPDRLGRVQVAMTAHGNIESDWLQVLAPGAGQGKGLVAPPDVGDHVLLLLDRADFAQAVVLGSLYGEGGLPEDQGGLGPDSSFCFVTPGGHRLRLDDGARTVHLEGSAGSQLHLAPEGVKLHAAAPLTIEAPGQTLTIRAKFIDFQRS